MGDIIQMPDGSSRDVAYRKCPTCGQEATGNPVDIGSGPEFACANCETCWGAEGQNLNPYDALRHIDESPELRKQFGWDDENGNPRLVLGFIACLECGMTIASRWNPKTGTDPVENCTQHTGEDANNLTSGETP